MTDLWRQWSPRNPDGSVRWSWHVIQRYLRCPRLFELSVVEDLVSTQYNGPLETGTAYHRGLAAMFLTLKQLQERTGKLFLRLTDDGLAKLADLAEHTINQCPDVTEEDRWQAIRLARCYCNGTESGEGGPRDFSEWQILVVEEPVSVDLGVYLDGQSFPWQQTVDLLVRVGGAWVQDYWHGVWVVDHKTQKQLGGVSTRKYMQDGQAILSTAVARQYGARGFIPNIISKQATPKCLREYIEFDQEKIAQFVRNLYRWQREIVQWLTLGVKGWKLNENACEDRYGYCEFFPLCKEGDYGTYVRRSELQPGDKVWGMG